MRSSDPATMPSTEVWHWACHRAASPREVHADDRHLGSTGHWRCCPVGKLGKELTSKEAVASGVGTLDWELGRALQFCRTKDVRHRVAVGHRNRGGQRLGKHLAFPTSRTSAVGKATPTRTATLAHGATCPLGPRNLPATGTPACPVSQDEPPGRTGFQFQQGGSLWAPDPRVIQRYQPWG